LRSGFILRAVCLFLAALCLPVERAFADEPQGGIRDAEIESIIRGWVTPIWKAAGLDPDAIHIYLVNDPTINSDVCCGQNIFINTGLVLKAESPNELIGVIAHESGHIAGGHLVRSEEAMKNASIESIIGIIIGAAATVAGGRDSNAGGGAILAGESVGIRSFLAFSVAQEATADHAALTYLDRCHMSAKGLLDLFELLQQEELLSGSRQDPMLIDHPLTDQRVEYVREHVANSPYSNQSDPPEQVEQFKVIQAKLKAFLDAPAETLDEYKADDNSVPARYARAIAYYHVPELTKALGIIDGLIHDHPDNPYFYELKGQMLFEDGHVAEAVAPYEQAVKLRPDVPLLRIELAQVQLETNDPTLVKNALTMLNGVLPMEERDPDTYRLLAIGYGRSGNMGMAALSVAQQGMAEGDFALAREQANRAIKLLPPGANRMTAEDIAAEAQRDQKHND
jgi:predicted Zn-dependent protease